jgi:chromosome partitioning protein
LIAAVSEFRQEFTEAGPLVVSGVLITKADRTLVSKQVESEVRSYFGDKVFDRPVPTSVKFREAYGHGIPLIRYDRLGAGATAYRAAAEAFFQGRGDHRVEPEQVLLGS